MKTYQPLTEAAIISAFYESNLDEGLGDLLKKAVGAVKQMSSAVKTFMLSKADQIASWVDKNIFEPLKTYLSKLIPGYSWGSNKNNEDGLIESVIKILAKANDQVVENVGGRFSDRKAERVSEGIQRYVRTVGSSHFQERRSPIVEAGAIGAVLSVIHWSHFAVDVLEAILKFAPSIPFLAGLSSKLLKVTKMLQSNPKMAKLVDWWEHGKIKGLNIPVKDAVNAICIAVGIVEICMGGGIFIIVSTAASAAWVIFEKIWHHYKAHDKDAKAIKESFLRGSNNSRFEESAQDLEDDYEDYDCDPDEDDCDDEDIDSELEDNEDDDYDCDPDEEDCEDIELDSEDEEDFDSDNEDGDDDIDDEDEIDEDIEEEDDTEDEEDFDLEDEIDDIDTELENAENDEEDFEDEDIDDEEEDEEDEVILSNEAKRRLNRSRFSESKFQRRRQIRKEYSRERSVEYFED